MVRWAFALGVVVAAGAVTLWYSYRLGAHSLSGLPPTEAKPELLAVSALPTALFLAAALVLRKTVAAVAAAAVVVATARVLTIQHELSEPWTRATGLLSAVAWAAGTVVAGVACVTAVVLAVAARVRARPAADTVP